MNILFVTTKLNFERSGGSVPDLDLKVRDMKALGEDVRVLTVFSELNQKPLEVPYPVEEEMVHNKSLFLMQFSVFNFLRAHAKDADVLHIEGQFIYAATFYRLCGGVPIVLFYNREMPLWMWRSGSVWQRTRHFLRTLLERVLNMVAVPFVNHTIFTTPQLALRYRAFGLCIPRSRFSTMPDFVDSDEIRRSVSAIDKKKSGEQVHIFASGRLIREKGFDLLINAVALLPSDTRKKVRVMIGGDGPEKIALEEKVRAHNLMDIIEFPGWVEKSRMRKTLATADIFVLPRWHHELSSVILLEALALGIPSIVPGGGGLAWVGRTGVTEFVADDERSLADTLARLVSVPDERVRLSHRARKRSDEIDHTVLREALHGVFKKVALKAA